MSAFSDIFRKAHEALNNLRGNNNISLGKDGEIIFSKNNVCVHELINEDENNYDCADYNINHIPGYLTVHCAHDEIIGVTLILQWLPNKTLEKNPASIRCVSPRSCNNIIDKKELHNEIDNIDNTKDNTIDKGIIINKNENNEDTTKYDTNEISKPSDIIVEIEGEISSFDNDNFQNSSRPKAFSFSLNENSHTSKEKSNENKKLSKKELFVPSINVIPNTPVEGNDDDLFEQHIHLEDEENDRSQSSASTSEADEIEEEISDFMDSSSDDNNDYTNEKFSNAQYNFMKEYKKKVQMCVSETPEKIAKSCKLLICDESKNEDSYITLDQERVIYQHNPIHKACLFSVNLAKMKSMRVFYSNSECTSGQLVIASRDGQYKILHFHYGGLDKLSSIFEQWKLVKGRSLKDGSPSIISDRHLLIYHPDINREDMDPEDGIYEKLNTTTWKSFKAEDGSISEEMTLKKNIFFASIEKNLRKEIWPLLLGVYPWNSTYESREQIRNDLFLKYQYIKKKQLHKMKSNNHEFWHNIQSSIIKDVMRTDRNNPFFQGDSNPNLNDMKEILMNYAITHKTVNYIQGMSDLLSPILRAIGNEADAYWCFVKFMERTLFVPCDKKGLLHSVMENQLNFLSNLCKLLLPDFYKYLNNVSSTGLSFMYCHRWLLLFFKREFQENDVMHIWEACWSNYKTKYCHLFICIAISSIYASDIIKQDMNYDEILFFFSSLANHMDATVVLQKTRGLIYKVNRMDILPCSLFGLLIDDDKHDQWNTHLPKRKYQCDLCKDSKINCIEKRKNSNNM
ncbi:TBC1 domain family member 16 [Strongyloides ratti]|uniref:TBC1 domain family member 16 n=1 Tax=Strongyloides ratti TaxID=34506 RepID=A0A090KRR5_STRRB|nr:TBC1 domain family member 16 [Strongyloides ratti]CEF60085.1 TBC1 domain family member 16 [Strongyloides ratti]